MFCQNCGKTLEDGCKFCSACGTPTPPSDEGFKVQSPEFDTQPDATPVQEETKVKKSGKGAKILVIIVAVLLLLAACGFIFRDTVCALWYKCMPAEKQLSYTYYRAVSDFTDDFSELYTLALQNVNNPKDVKSDLNVTLSNELIDLFNDQTGINMDTMRDITLSCQAEQNSLYDYAYSLKLKLGSNDIATILCEYDVKNSLMRIAIPELNDTTLQIEIDSELQQFIIPFIEEYHPDAELFKKVLPSVIKAAFSEIDDVTVTKSTLEVGDVSRKATCLHTELSADDLGDILKAVCNELKENKAFNDYIDTLANNIENDDAAFADFSGDDVTDLVDDILYEIKDFALNELTGDREIVSFKTYVDFNYNIIGVELSDKKFENGILFGYATKGKTVQFALSVKASDEEVLTVAAEFSAKKKKLNGNIEVMGSIDGDGLQTVLEAEVTDLSLSDKKSSELSGNIAITLGDAITDELDLQEKISIELSYSGSVDTPCIDAAFKYGKNTYVTLSTSSHFEDVEITLPANIVDDADEWASMIDTSKLYELAEDIPLLSLFFFIQ